MWIIIYLYLFVFAFVLSLLLTPALRRFAVGWRVLDAPSERKVHLSPKPLLGGLALYLSFIITVFLNLFLLKIVLNSPNLLSFVPQFAVDRLPSFQKELSQVKPLAIGSTLIVLVGLMDDIKGMNPSIKLLCSALIAVIMVFLGVKISFFIPHPFWSGVLTIVWMVLIMNSFNLLDNMDGLACGVALIAASIFFGITALQHQLFTSSMLIVFASVLAGFLIFNWYPSSIFMGDTGSMWIGFMMANLTVIATFYSEGKPTLFPVIMPLLILGVPIFDTISVMIIRFFRRKSFFIGDKNHFSHRLVQLGMTQPQAVAFIYLVTFCIGINATLLSTVGKLGAMVILLQAVVIFVIIALLEYTGRKSIEKPR
jgi:UDP-GlcNAc:undecaprenyl-phosphate GlcNAc-1-phosphate transferase